jgi:hypothetical protein
MLPCACKDSDRNRDPIDRDLTGLAILPTLLVMPRHQAFSFTATGEYKNGSEIDLTAEVEWKSSNSSVVMFSKISGEEGHALSIVPGKTGVTCTLGECSSNETTLTVTDAEIVSIDVTPKDARIPLGRVMQYTAVGTFNDNSEFPVTINADWHSDNEQCVIMHNTVGLWGIAESVAIGSANVTASMDGVLSEPVIVAVVEPALDNMTISPGSAHLSPGTSRQFSALGVYSDQSTRLITLFAEWSSSNKSVASFDVGKGGLLHAHTLGRTTVTASLDNVTSQAAVVKVTEVAFCDVTAEAKVGCPDPTAEVTAADYNFDGLVDIYVGNYCRSNVLYASNGDGTFSDMTGIAQVKGDLYAGGPIPGPTRGVLWGDVEGDGLLDIYLSNGYTNGLGLANIFYGGSVSGVFDDLSLAYGLRAQGTTTWAAAWGDYNNDGRLDLYIANGSPGGGADAPNVLYKNMGNGIFFDATAEAGVGDKRQSTCCTFIDYDEDGHVDIVVGNFGKPNACFRNLGNGAFTDVAADAGLDDNGNTVSLAWGDFDSDGHEDLYVVNAGFSGSDNRAMTDRLYRYDGMGAFDELGNAAGVVGVRDRRGAAWADFDLDGFLDLSRTCCTAISETALLLTSRLNAEFSRAIIPRRAYGSTTTTTETWTCTSAAPGPRPRRTSCS